MIADRVTGFILSTAVDNGPASFTDCTFYRVEYLLNLTSFDYNLERMWVDGE